mmetsp:Transcript_3571/g.6522  ORF Transcript_3571/g.6522 Transcript_3571/m.6522 type:complete len:788 (+) Transcript_3571:149-2512(+)|eukprot:CAMPEP_0201933994 /NCGR_PEP_ID=MMETSP0903-20130614/32715_1 /ASSEMBLY_ACC=CAM_ASM_000552 /TAXON_ID=420261 /ORGANISM="Thalassiosira antarctica, Strain CCMP982" /LENGTH=787 /DNA_ID=CAMNT_0048474091 /DNA_START=130 /DNA_END=2493 /DNA_ORIENTATION=+
MTAKELILAHLRREKIRLWMPPYYHRSSDLPDTEGGDNAKNEALTKLAESLKRKMTTISPTSNTMDENSNDCSSGVVPTTEEICSVLVDLQSHAVQRLKDKNSVHVKILASKRHFAVLFPEGEDHDAAAFSNSASWGDEISILSTTHRDNNKALLLRVINLSPTLTVDEFSSDICRALNAKTVRVIWKGKNLLSSTSVGGEQDTLKKIVAVNNNSNTGGNTMATPSNQKKKNELLCLVSGFGYVSPASSAVASAAGAAASDIRGMAPAVRTDSSIIESIRQAAHTSGSGSRFEVTDQSGNLVPMRQSDTVAFLTALGLHRIGRSKMERRDSVISMADTDTASGEDSSGRDVASALVFLLGADAEWNNSPALENWKNKVDNYGLLQLDIAWCYLLLESLDGLTDAVRRLDIAEQVLRKQVHTNFVTLALAQAEMDNPIPPLSSIFVRLFLLQGVANKMQNCNATAAERLGWARLLCHRLRSSCPVDCVETLCNAYVVEPSTAIAALRRSNGDPDAAGNFIAMGRDEERQAAKKRRRQHKMGRCSNGVDFVNLDLVPTLSSLLGYGDAMGNLGNTDEDDDGKAFGDDLSTSTMIVIGLLRLSNNIIDQSLELYNSIGAQKVLEQIARLDEASSRRKRRSTKNTERKKPTEYEVRDVDLIMLVSMGLEEARGRDALQAAGNVESALLWLSREDDGHDDTKTDSKTSEEVTSDKDGHLEGKANDSTVRDHSESDDGDDSTSDSGDNGTDDAHELLERELGNALGADSRQLLEKEWLGVDMQDEWDLIQKYI